MAKELQIIIEASDKASGVLHGVRGALGGIGDMAGNALKLGLGAALGGVTALTAGLGFSVKAATDAEGIQAQLAAVLKSTGGAAGVTAAMANDLATSLSQLTPFEDDAIVKGENMLLTFTNIGKDVFPQATETMLDLAQAMGGDLQGAAIQLGKALNDPTKGMTALTRVGVTFSDEQKKLIKDLQAAGKMEEAQAVILAELQKEFGGSAKAAGQTFGGTMTRLQNTLGNVAESIGGALLPMLTKFADTLTTALASPAIQKAISGITEGLSMMASGQIMDGLARLLDVFGVAEPQAIALLNAIQGFIDVLIGGTEPLGDWSSMWELIADGFGGDVADAVVGLMQTLAGLRDFILTQAIPMLSQLWQTFLRDGLPLLIRFAQEIFPAIGQVITEVVIPGVRQLAEWALPLLAGAVKFVADNWEVFKVIGIAVAAIIVALNAPIALILAALVVLGAAWANNWGGIRDITESVLKTVQDIVSGALAAIEGFWSEHGAQIMLILDTAWAVIQAVLDVAIKNVQSIIAAFTAAMNGDWEAFGSNLRDVWDRTWELIGKAVEIAKDILGKAAKALADKVIEVITTTDWLKLGRDIVQGIINGIKAMAGEVSKAASGIGDAIVDGTKGFLRIKSPSGVFEAEVGVPILDGITEGLKSPGALSDMLQAAQNGITAMLNAMRNLISGGAGGSAMGYELAVAIGDGVRANESVIQVGVQDAVYAAVSAASVTTDVRAAAQALGREVTNAIGSGVNDSIARGNLTQSIYSVIDNAVAGVVHSGPPYNWDGGARSLGASIAGALSGGVFDGQNNLREAIDSMILFALWDARAQSSWWPVAYTLGTDIVNGIIAGVWSMQSALADAIKAVTGGGGAPTLAFAGASNGAAGGGGNTYVLNIYSSAPASVEPVVQDFLLLKAVMR